MVMKQLKIVNKDAEETFLNEVSLNCFHKFQISFESLKFRAAGSKGRLILGKKYPNESVDSISLLYTLGYSFEYLIRVCSLSLIQRASLSASLY